MLGKIKIKPMSDKQLRRFGFEMSVILTLIGAWLVWKGSIIGQVLAIIAGIFAIIAIWAPRWIWGFAKFWIGLGLVLGMIVTPVVVIIVYYIAVTPMGLLLKLLGKDLLKRKIDRSAESYWIKVEEDGPGKRFFTPY